MLSAACNPEIGQLSQNTSAIIQSSLRKAHNFTVFRQKTTTKCTQHVIKDCNCKYLYTHLNLIHGKEYRNHFAVGESVNH